MKKVFKCCDNDLTFQNGDFVTIMSNNSNIPEFVIKDKIQIINYNNLFCFDNISVSNVIKKYLKMPQRIKEYLCEFNLIEYKNINIKNLNTNEKIKLLIMLSIIQKEKIIVIDNLLSMLDYVDYKLIVKILKKYSKNSIILNITNNVEESLIGNKIAIIYNNKLICFGETLSVLNEEKTFKRLGFGLPFIIELNKYLIDYGLIDTYYLSNKKLVDALWK